jgi:hypothetical protein
VLEAVERVLDGPLSPRMIDEAREAFYFVLWTALEDEALQEQAWALDGRLCEVVAA